MDMRYNDEPQTFLKGAIFKDIDPLYTRLFSGGIADVGRYSEYKTTLFEALKEWRELGDYQYELIALPAEKPKRTEGDILAEDVSVNVNVNKSFERDGIGAYLTMNCASWSVTLYSSERVENEKILDLLAAMEKLRKIRPKPITIQKDDTIKVTLTSWNNSEGGFVQTFHKNVKMPTIDEVSDNYPPSVIAEIKKMAATRRRDPARLVLWHGAPGTGKTYALRALMKDMYGEYYPIVIADPEQLCNNIAYYKGISLSLMRRDIGTALIMEDAAQLLKRGDSGVNLTMINRLLNLTDGILGQGDESIFIVTFNENIGAIDEAFTRSGRCRSLVEFSKFNEEQSNAWLQKRGCQPRKGSHSLAELYGFKAEEGK